MGENLKSQEALCLLAETAFPTSLSRNPGCQLVVGLSVKPHASLAETSTSWQLVGHFVRRPEFASGIKDACAPRLGFKRRIISDY